jgi:hypothetical protein
MAWLEESAKTGKLKLYFDSIQDVFETIQREGWTPQHSKSSDARGTDGGFYTFGSLDEAHDIFWHHPETIRQFSINDEKLVSKDSPGKDIQYEVTGDYVDIDRYLEGVPENFGQAILGNPKSVFATINILNSAVNWTSPEYMLHKQRRIMRLVDWLEAQDIRCQIVLTEDSSVSYSQIIVKQSHDPFDLNALAVGMHPDFFRRTCFLFMEQSKTWEYGYGSAQEYDKRMQGYKSNPEDGLYVYVGGYIPYQNNDTKALDKDFDAIEGSIQEMIDLGLSFTEDSLTVKGSSRGF